MQPLNVVVVMVDQMKATASHLWGCHWNQTPGLAALARHGVRFDMAFTPHPLCVPARVAFWSSLFPHNSGVRTNSGGMPGHAWHPFKLWKAQGYRTAMIGKDHCFMRPDDQALFDVWCEIGHTGPEGSWRGMDWVRNPADIAADHAIRQRMENPSDAQPAGYVRTKSFNYAVTDRPLGTYATSIITSQAERFLDLHGAQSFVMWLSYPDPHNPYEAPKQWFDDIRPRVRYPAWRRDEFADAPERNKVLWRLMDLSGESDHDVRGIIAAYHAMVAFVDGQVTRLLSALERHGMMERTLIVFCSDHGDFAAEHMMFGKGGAFYDCLTRVPLVVALKGAGWAGSVESAPVSLLDVVPTILELQGLALPAGRDGQVLPSVTPAPRRAFAVSEYGAGGPPVTLADLDRDGVPHGRGGVKATLQAREAEGQRRMLRTSGWKYVHDPMGDLDELYDLSADPGELFNLAGFEHCRTRAAEMKELLDRWCEITAA